MWFLWYLLGMTERLLRRPNFFSTKWRTSRKISAYKLASWSTPSSQSSVLAIPHTRKHPFLHWVVSCKVICWSYRPSHSWMCLIATRTNQWKCKQNDMLKRSDTWSLIKKLCRRFKRKKRKRNFKKRQQFKVLRKTCWTRSWWSSKVNQWQWTSRIWTNWWRRTMKWWLNTKERHYRSRDTGWWAPTVQ